jgi:hypothetical protein
VIAEKVIYHQLVIKSDEQLEKIRSRLLQTMGHPTRDITEWVRHVRLQLHKPPSCKELQRQENITAMSMSLSRLRSFDLGLHFINISLMVGLTQLLSLTRLSMQLHKHCPADITPLINHMNNLKELVIDCGYGEPELWPVDRPIIRPSILKLTLVGPTDAPAFMKYLACCRVHSSCQVTLKLPCQILDDTILSIVPFLAAHALCKIQLDLDLELNEYLGAIGDVLASIPHVVFMDAYSLWGLFVDQSSLPLIVEISLDLSAAEAEIVWELFDSILVLRERSVGSPSTIRIRSRVCPVRWTMAGRESDDEAAFIGRMLRYALLFYRHGVYVVDQDWKDVRDILRAPVQPCSCGLHEIALDRFTVQTRLES